MKAQQLPRPTDPRLLAAACLAALTASLLCLSFVTIERLKYAYLAGRPSLGPAFLAANLRPQDAIFAAAAVRRRHRSRTDRIAPPRS